MSHQLGFTGINASASYVAPSQERRASATRRNAQSSDQTGISTHRTLRRIRQPNRLNV